MSNLVFPKCELGPAQVDDRLVSDTMARAAKLCRECRTQGAPSYWYDGTPADETDVICTHGPTITETPCFAEEIWQPYYWARDRDKITKDAGR